MHGVIAMKSESDGGVLQLRKRTAEPRAASNHSSASTNAHWNLVLSARRAVHHCESLHLTTKYSVAREMPYQNCNFYDIPEKFALSVD